MDQNELPEYLHKAAEAVDEMLCGQVGSVDAERVRARFEEGAEKATQWYAWHLAARKSPGNLLRDSTNPKHWEKFGDGADCSTADCHYGVLAVLHKMVYGNAVTPLRVPSWRLPKRRLSMKRQISDMARQGGDAGLVYQSVVWGLISTGRDGYTPETIDAVLRHVICDIAALGKAKALRSPAKGYVATQPQSPTQAETTPRQGVGTGNENNWTPPDGYISTQEITDPKGKYGVPRPTLQGWQKQDDVAGGPLHNKLVKAPDSTHQLYYPEKWVQLRVEKWKPRKHKRR